MTYLGSVRLECVVMGELINVVDLSKKRCFHGGVGIDNEVICNEYIRRGGVIVENQQKITGSK